MHDEFENVGPRIMACNIELPPGTHQLFLTNVRVENRLQFGRRPLQDPPVRIDDDTAAWVDPTEAKAARRLVSDGS